MLFRSVAGSMLSVEDSLSECFVRVPRSAAVKFSLVQRPLFTPRVDRVLLRTEFVVTDDALRCVRNFLVALLPAS